MKTKSFVTAALAILCLSRGAAQSVPELLDQGIYTQETVGDLDRAIAIYRQIVTSAPADRSYAAQAQYRLAQCLLQKGAQADAASEFRKVIEGYPKDKDLVEKARQAILPLAHYVDGEYSDPVLGLSFRSPEWTIGQVYRADDGSVEVGLRAIFNPPGHPYRVDFPTFMARKSKMNSVQAFYREYPKEQCPTCVYHVLSTRESKGWQVLSFVGDPMSNNLNPGVPTLAYAVLIETGKTEMMIRAIVPAQDLDRAKAIVEKILESVQAP